MLLFSRQLSIWFLKGPWHVLALWSGWKWQAPKRKYLINWPKQKEASICSKYPLWKSNKTSFCLKKANQTRYEYLFPNRWQLWHPLCFQRQWNGVLTPYPPNRGCWMSCQFVLDLALSGNAHPAVTLSFPSWKQYYSRKSSPKAVQVPLLAQVGRPAHGQCGKPCATDISLWSLATRRALWPDASAPNKLLAL